MKWDKLTIAVAVPVAVVAIFAAVQSYTHIEALALAQHQSLTDARMLPFVVDGLIVAGSVLLLGRYWLGWLGVVIGAAATVYANVMSGLPYGSHAATVAAAPAISFLVATYMLERWIKWQVGRGGTGGSGRAGNDNNVLLETVPDSDLVGGGRRDLRCGHEFGQTPEEKIVNDYLHERDCLGGKPSQRRLATTYNVSRTKVAQLVGSLNGNGGHDAADT